MVNALIQYQRACSTAVHKIVSAVRLSNRGRDAYNESLDTEMRVRRVRRNTSPRVLAKMDNGAG
jgi:hypothetical protein